MATNIFAETSGTFSFQLAENYSLVEQGDKIGVLEIMKMEHTIEAPVSGVVVWTCDIGQYVNEGDLLAIISEETERTEAKVKNGKQEFWNRQISGAEDIRIAKQDATSGD